MAVMVAFVNIKAVPQNVLGIDYLVMHFGRKADAEYKGLLCIHSVL